MWEIYYFICDVYLAHKQVVYAGASRAWTLKTVSSVQITVRMRVLYNSQTNIYLTRRNERLFCLWNVLCLLRNTVCV